MVPPTGEIQPEDAQELLGRALLLLAEIKDYNRRMCEVMERLLGKQPDDPRYRSNVYRDRS